MRERKRVGEGKKREKERGDSLDFMSIIFNA